MNKKKTILLFTLTLLLGGVLGFFVSGRLMKKRMHHHRTLIQNADMEKKHLVRVLKLSEEQTATLSPVIDKSLKEQHALRGKHRGEMKALRTQMFDEMKKDLDAEQLQTVHKILHRESRSGPPPRMRRID